MSPELDEKLCAKYPKIFVDRHADMHTTAMCWGFDVGDGWYNIIDALCANIQGRIDWREKTRKTDLDFNAALQKALDGDSSDLLAHYCRGKEPSEWTLGRVDADIKLGTLRKIEPEIPQVVAVQIKEKFGTLRFYVNGGDDAIHGMISLAESMSARTCETCGSPGKSRGGGWIYTACDAHTREEDKLETEDA